jgi:flagellar biosynthesis protein FliR
MTGEWYPQLPLGMLIFARCAGAVCLAPPTGWRYFPVSLRLAVAAAISLPLGLTFSGSMAALDSHSLAYLSALVRELAVGLALGLPLWLLVWGFGAAGGLVDEVNGWSGEGEGPLGQFLPLLACVLFVLLNGLHWLVAFLQASYGLLPPGAGALHLNGALAEVWLGWPTGLLLCALNVAAPLLLAVGLASALVAALERCAPGFPVGQLGSPLRWATSVAALVVILPLFGTLLLGQLDGIAAHLAQALVHWRS